MNATVHEVMTSPVTSVSPDTDLKDAAARLRAGRFSALPVVDARGRLVGILSEADLLVKTEPPAPGARAATLACHLMTRPVVTVAAGTSLAVAAELMLQYGVQRLPVVDDAGRPVGIVSRGDLLDVFLRSDEEVRRDVRSCLRAEGLRDVVTCVEDGVVTLSAPVRASVQRAIEAVAGVVAVRNASPSPCDERRPEMNVSAAEIEVLSEEECMELLRSHHVGRVAVVDDGQPLIFPVNYATDDRAVVFRTAPGMKLHQAPMSRVAFEIDEVDTVAGTAWSVLVKGVAYEITEALDSLSERLRQLVVEPMAPGERPNWVAVMRREISGRRFRLSG